MQHDVTLQRCYIIGNIDRLWNVAASADRKPVSKTTGQFDHRFLAHAINKDVGRCIAKDTRPQFILPIVVMGKSAQGSLDTA
jgi:hypothetical protein